MRRRTQRVAAYAVIINGERDVLLVRAGGQSATPGWWYLPGGGVEFGEPPEAAVAREVREETSLTVDVRRRPVVLCDVMDNKRDGVETHTIRLVYEASEWRGVVCDEADGTSDLARWHPVTNLPAKAMPFVAAAIEALAHT